MRRVISVLSLLGLVLTASACSNARPHNGPKGAYVEAGGGVVD